MLKSTGVAHSNSKVMIHGGGTGFRFNQEGNQAVCRCGVKRVITINFDRKAVRCISYLRYV